MNGYATKEYGAVGRDCCPRCDSDRPSVPNPVGLPGYTCRHAWHMPERLTPRARDAVSFAAAVDRMFSGDPDVPRYATPEDMSRISSAEWPQ
jgi:hypothetical protein